MRQLIALYASAWLLLQVTCCESSFKNWFQSSDNDDDEASANDQGFLSHHEDATLSNKNDNHFGVDVSFPMHHSTLQTPGTKDEPLWESTYKEQFYQEWLQGCRDYFSSHPQACDTHEADRLSMNYHQPPQMTNFTTAGYAKIRIPKGLRTKLQSYWNHVQQQQQQPQQQQPELWPVGNTYTNQWASSTHMVGNIHQYDRGNLATEVITTTQDILEAWIGGGQPLVPTSLYGIRKYTAKSVLAPHVDRLPLVISAIMNIAQDVDEPWPLEVIGHDGKAHNITMDPGEMILYESHSIIHGRPYPLEGRYYANLFVHFEPYGYSRRHHHATVESEARRRRSDGGKNNNNKKDKINNPKKELYKQALARSKSKSNKQHKDPHETITRTTTRKNPSFQDALEEQRWTQNFAWQDIKDLSKDANGQSRTMSSSFSSSTDNKKKPVVKGKMAKTGLNTAHNAAAHGDLSMLQYLAEDDPSVLHSIDQNKWTPLHEAARSGETDVIEYLIENGVDVNALNVNGETPTYWALQRHPKSHPAVLALKRAGGIAQGSAMKKSNTK